MNEGRIKATDRSMLKLWESGLAAKEINRAFPGFQLRVDRYRLRGVSNGRNVDWARFEEIDLEAEKAEEAENRWLEDWAILFLWQESHFTAEEINQAIPNFHYRLHLYQLRGVVDGQNVGWDRFEEMKFVEKVWSGTEKQQVVAADRRRLSDRVVLAHWENVLTEQEMNLAFAN